jgi:hypothetical protein
MLERRGAALFVHPGPAPGTQPYALDAGMPIWWPNLGVYPGLSIRAFFGWRTLGAPRWPDQRVCFAIMAGGAPFLEERWRAFSGETRAIDRNLYMDTASCGRLALECGLATYGVEQIVLGTDIPVISPLPLGRALTDSGCGRRGRGRATNPSGVRPDGASMSDHDTDLHGFFRERLGDHDLDPEQAEALAAELAAARRAVAAPRPAQQRGAHLQRALPRPPPGRVVDLLERHPGHRAARPRPVRRGRAGRGRCADEDRLCLGSGIDTTRYDAGQSFRFDASRIHDVRNAAGHTTISLHMYSPPLWRMGYYDVGDDGRISRRSASYAEELRP